MPKIRRYHPISHDLNGDPEVWALTKLCGDRSLRVWLEILSIADRNDGFVPGSQRPVDNFQSTVPQPLVRPSSTMCQTFARTLSGRCQVSANTVTKVWQLAHDYAWIVSDPVPRVVKYAEYHRTREQRKSRAGTNEAPSETSETSETTKTKEDLKEPVDNSKPKPKDSEALAAACVKVCAADPSRFAGGPTNLIEWQHHGVMALERTESREVAVSVILETLAQLAKALKDGKVSGEWRPYAEAIRIRIRSKTLMSESENHKKYEPDSVGGIFADVLRRTEKASHGRN